jgi:cytochrome c oxidase subunit 4
MAASPPSRLDPLADAAPAAEGAHVGAGPRTYLVIGGFLFLLTVMEVAVFYIEQLSPVLVPVLIFLALAKFILVAMFYMHLRFDHAWFSYLFVGPLVIATGLAVSLLWLFGVFGTTGRLVGG